MMQTDPWDGVALEPEQIKLLDKVWPIHRRHLMNLQMLRLYRPWLADTLLGMAEDFCRDVTSDTISGPAPHRDRLLARVPKPRPVGTSLKLVRRIAQSR